jgi:hypothetical protein
MVFWDSESVGWSSGDRGLGIGKVDFGLCDVVDEVGQQKLDRKGYDLDNLRIGVAGVAHGSKIGVGDLPSCLGHSLGKLCCRRACRWRQGHHG